MALSLRDKRYVCGVSIAVFGIVPGLIMAIGPWPISIHVSHRELQSAWFRAEMSDSIYVARVRHVGGVVWRRATCDVLEVIKGPDLPKVIREPLGETFGQDDVGKTFIVFEGVRRSWKTSPVDHDPTLTPGPSPPLVLRAGPKSHQYETVEFVRQIVKVQSAGDKLSEEQAQLIQAWLEDDALHHSPSLHHLWNWLSYKERCPRAKKLVDSYLSR